MIGKFDHVTILVSDPAAGRRFFALLGFNYICFSVDGLEAAVARLAAAGGRLRNRTMEFQRRKLARWH